MTRVPVICVCLVLFLSLGAVFGQELTLRAADLPPTPHALVEMASLVAMRDSADLPADWAALASRARSLLENEGSIVYYAPQPGQRAPAHAALAQANAQGWAGERVLGADRYVTHTTQGLLLTAALKLGDWATVEQVGLAVLSAMASGEAIYDHMPSGVHFLLDKARKELAAGERSLTEDVLVCAGAPGYVPARAGSAELRRVAQWLGGSLTWDKAAETGRLKLGKETWAFKLGSRTVASSSGKRMELPATVKMYDGRLRVPLEALKIAGTVKWDSTTRIAWFTPKQG